jgi:hypothetical protein
MSIEEIKKLKPGDKIICLGNAPGFQEGEIYTVRENPDRYGNVGVEVDSNGLTTNGWRAINFILAEKFIHDEKFNNKFNKWLKEEE